MLDLCNMVFCKSSLKKYLWIQIYSWHTTDRLDERKFQNINLRVKIRKNLSVFLRIMKSCFLLMNQVRKRKKNYQQTIKNYRSIFQNIIFSLGSDQTTHRRYSGAKNSLEVTYIRQIDQITFNIFRFDLAK